MLRFEIYSNGTLIGRSDLELGDAPMGVAAGRFIPLPAYEQIRASVPTDLVKRKTPSQDHLNLTIRETGGKEVIGSGGVHITDCSEALGPDGIEVELLGVGYPLYEELFPQHVAAYKKQWRKA
jgi:hypothetical protein